MSDVQFEEDDQFSSGGSLQSRRILGVPATPGMVRLLGKFGVRDEKVAGYILIAVVLIATTLAVVIFARELSGGGKTRLLPASPSQNSSFIDPGNLVL